MNAAQRRIARRIVSRAFPDGASVFVANGESLQRGKVIGTRNEDLHGNYRLTAKCIVVKSTNGRNYFRRPDQLVLAG